MKLFSFPLFKIYGFQGDFIDIVLSYFSCYLEWFKRVINLMSEPGSENRQFPVKTSKYRPGKIYNVTGY